MSFPVLTHVEKLKSKIDVIGAACSCAKKRYKCLLQSLYNGYSTDSGNHPSNGQALCFIFLLAEESAELLVISKYNEFKYFSGVVCYELLPFGGNYMLPHLCILPCGARAISW